MATDMEVYSSLAQFTSDVYSQVAVQQTTEVNNVFMSSLSIYIALLMTLVGAGGQTRTEMRNSLHIPPHLEGDELHKSFGPTLMKHFFDSTDVNLTLANRLFIFRNVHLLKKFKKSLTESYSTHVEVLPQCGDLEKKQLTVNEWVSEETNSKISEVLREGALKADDVLALVNAVHFKGLWKLPFDKELTKPAPFECLDGSTVQVPMMFLKERLPYEDLTEFAAEAIKLPFGNSLWELLIVLPYDQDGLLDLLTQFQNNDTLSSILAKPFYETKIYLHLPRFKLTESLPLNIKKMLQDIGMKSLFEETADLSNMFSDDNFFVSELIHKAMFEIDEKGVVAAATTGVLATFHSALNTDIRVDHPFFMALVYNATVPVFVGHVVKPEAA